MVVAGEAEAAAGEEVAEGCWGLSGHLRDPRTQLTSRRSKELL